MAQFDNHNSQVWRVSWNITSTLLASSGDDGCVRLWKGGKQFLAATTYFFTYCWLTRKMYSIDATLLLQFGLFIILMLAKIFF